MSPTTLVIESDQFPHVFPREARIGDEVALQVIGVISQTEADVIDVTEFTRPEHLLGKTRATILVTSLTPA